jgi:glucose-1-phosphate cytidylyltransferase
VRLVDTGLETITGGRLKRLEGMLRDGGTFLMTYGDGVSDVDLSRLVAFHRAHGKLATVTAVRPPARFGGIELERNQVVRFTEKPQIGEGWINGGFFVLEPRVLDYIAGDATHWEGEPLECLTAEGQLMAYCHDAFWQCMDTLRDKRLFDSLWASGSAPWKVWD